MEYMQGKREQRIINAQVFYKLNWYAEKRTVSQVLIYGRDVIEINNTQWNIKDQPTHT